METTTKLSINVSDINELTTKTISAIEKIKDFRTHNGYQTNITFPDELLSYKNIYSGLNNLSRKQRKILRNYIYSIERHATINKSNRFLHQLLKVVLGSDVRVKILKSDKELTIQAKRKVYKDAIAAARKAQVEYKSEKGNFYKDRICKNQAI